MKLPRRLAFLLLLSLSGRLAAQSMPVRRFTVQDGLAQSQITSMLQDHRGFLWIGTQAGLSRWDGIHFQTWTKEEGLPDDVVTALALGAGDTLWIGTDSGALARFSSGFPGQSLSTLRNGSAKVNALLNLSEWQLVLGSERGLFVLDEAGSETRLLEEEILLLLKGKNGTFWAVGKHNAHQFGPEIEEKTSLFLPTEPVTVFPGRQARILLADGRILDLASGSVLDEKLPALPAPTAVAGLPGETLWIGTHSALFRKRPESPVERVELNISHSILDIRCLLLDREGDLWIGSWGSGLIQIPPGDMRVWTRATGFPSSTVWDFCEDPEGRIWMATEDAGAVVWNGKEILPEISRNSGLRSNRVLSLAADNRGNIWVGSDDGLLYRPTSGKPVLLGKKDGLPDTFIRDLAFDSSGRIWVATSGGLLCLDKDEQHA